MPLVAPLVALDVLVLVLWAIATALAIALIMRKIGDVFRAVPVVGGYIASAVDSVAQTISWAAGKLESGVDKAVGAAWHLFARYFDHLWNHLVASSGVLVQITEELARHAYALSRLRALVHKAVGTAEAFIPRVKTLEREWHGIEHRVKSLERAIARGIGHDLWIHIKALERTVHGIEHGVIPGLRAGIKTAEGEVTQLQDFIKAIPGTRYLDWAAGIVAAGLAVIGLDWLICRDGASRVGRANCALWDDLGDVFALLAAADLALNFDQFVRDCQAAADTTVVAVKDVTGL